MAHPSSSPIMEPSHVLPLRPVPKIQTMFSATTPRSSPAPEDRRTRERRDSPFLTARRQSLLNLGVNIVPPTPSGGLVGHKVIATIYSHKTYLHAMGHYTLTEPCLVAPDSRPRRRPSRNPSIISRNESQNPLTILRPCKIMWSCATVWSSCRGTFASQNIGSRRRSSSRVYLRRCSTMDGPTTNPRSGFEGGACRAAWGGQRPRGRALRRWGATRRL